MEFLYLQKFKIRATSGVKSVYSMSAEELGDRAREKIIQ